jgi:hypothetical protein
MKGRAEKALEKLAKQDQQPQMQTAMKAEEFAPATCTVSAPDAADLSNGSPPTLTLHLFVGELAPGHYVEVKRALLGADFAIQLGEHLVSEGRRVKTGLVIPQAQAPADLK